MRIRNYCIEKKGARPIFSARKGRSSKYERAKVRLQIALLNSSKDLR